MVSPVIWSNYTVKKGYQFSRPQPGCHSPNSPPLPHLPRKRSRLAKSQCIQSSKTVLKKSRLIEPTLSHISLFWYSLNTYYILQRWDWICVYPIAFVTNEYTVALKYVYYRKTRYSKWAYLPRKGSLFHHSYGGVSACETYTRGPSYLGHAYSVYCTVKFYSKALHFVLLIGRV